ncbi:hypothetical protein D3C81_1376240 [compost metagenome]
MHSPSATPSWAYCGGRYSMSPGSSTHSSSALKSARIFSGMSGTSSRLVCDEMRQRRRPETCSRNTS